MLVNLFFCFLNVVISEAGATTEVRLANGRNAPDGAFPWQVSVRNSKGDHICGGSIITKKYVLTSAHCKHHADASPYIIVGTNKRSSGGEHYKIDAIIPHENYNPTKVLTNDISVVRLSKEIEFNDRVQPIEIEKRFIKGGETCVVSGWGYTDNKNSVPDTLQMLTLTILAESDCKKRIDRLGVKYGKGNMCTDNMNGTGFCHGDSGSPMVQGQKQVGIASFTVPCGRSTSDVYTRLSYYIDWIQNKIQE